jgi:tetratricopeptide (TPR) repeat protein
MSMASSLVRTSPQSFKTHDLLANVLFASDPSHANIDRVIEESEKSRAILEPLPDGRQPADPYRFAANCYMIRGAYRKAIAVLLRYIAVEAAIDPARSQADAYLLLATAYSSSGETDKAQDAAARARGIDPLSPQLYRQMADTAVSAGKMDDAAVALIEGAFVTSDKTLRQDLVELYRRAMDPGSCVLTQGPSGPAINPACAAVHAHVCAASAYVVRTLAAAEQRDLAQTRKTMFIQQFGCPRGPLDEAWPTRP